MLRFRLWRCLTDVNPELLYQMLHNFKMASIDSEMKWVPHNSVFDFTREISTLDLAPILEKHHSFDVMKVFNFFIQAPDLYDLSALFQVKYTSWILFAFC
jgi:hypothetical protein